MRIIDENGLEIQSPDLTKGYLIPDKLFVAHHEAVPYIAEQGHYNPLHKYANGGQDVIWVVDVPGQEAQEAYDEYEDVLKYILFTPQQIEENNKPTEMELLKEENKMLKAKVDALTEQNTFHEELIVEMAQQVYA